MSLVEKSGLKATATPQITSSKAASIDQKNVKTELESQIEQDIKKLQQQIDAEQAEITKLQNSKKDKRLPATSDDQKQMAFETFKVSYKMNLIPSEASQVLFIDS